MKTRKPSSHRSSSGSSATNRIVSAEKQVKFVDELPKIPRIDKTTGGTLTISMEESMQSLGLVDSSGIEIQTKVWGYVEVDGDVRYLGPTIIAKKDIPLEIKWINNLPDTHFLPIDMSIHQAKPTNGIPTVVHLHGGHVEPESDGYPEAWFTNSFVEKGKEWVKEIYNYKNDQEAAPLWYHDHCMGRTRLNVYAGLAGMYLLRDENELSLNLPSGKYERCLVVQDKQFATDGSMYFPSTIEELKADFEVNETYNVEPTIMAEFFGDYILVNGKTWPKMTVEPTMYRFRVLNASDSRFYIFQLSNGSAFQMIGTEGGLLNQPLSLNQLLLAPGERADLVIDFSSMRGEKVVLENVGPEEPFKGVGAVPTQPLANMNSTRLIMRFDVADSEPSSTAVSSIPTQLRANPISRLNRDDVVNVRQLLLLEGMDRFGRLKPSLGTAIEGTKRWIDPVTENPNVNDVEIWEIYNNTEDAHPIHLHQITFELMNRQKFTGNLDESSKVLTDIRLVGDPLSPEPYEDGWKDTYIIPPGHVARYLVKFDIPGRFVWHCHILSHEDWDMMRPLDVVDELFKLDSTQTYYLNPRPVDMSLEFNRLQNVIESDMDLDPKSGDVFVFINNSKDRIKMMKWQNGNYIQTYFDLDGFNYEFDVQRKYTKMAWSDLARIVRQTGSNV